MSTMGARGSTQEAALSRLDSILDLVDGHDLALKRMGSFSNAAVEIAYREYLWLQNRRSVYVAFAVWVALQIAVSFEFELSVYTRYPLMLLVLFLGRLLPLAIAGMFLMKSSIRKWMLWWSPVAAFCIALGVIAAQLLALLCTRTGNPGDTSRQCTVFAADGIQPWVPLLLTAVLPLYLHFALQVRLLHASFVSLLAGAGYVGMVLALTSGDAIATSILAVLAPMFAAEVAGWAHERLLRMVFKRDAANRRRLQSWLQRELLSSVRAAQHKQLVDSIARVDVCLFEISTSGAITFTSPAARRMLGLPETEDAILSDMFAGIHPDDTAVARNAWNALLDAARTNQSARPTDVFRGFAEETQPFARLAYRRRRPDGRTFWVESQAHVVVRRPTEIPGAQTPIPAGEPSLLIMERDVQPERQALSKVIARLQKEASSVAPGTAPPAIPSLPTSAKILASSLPKATDEALVSATGAHMPPAASPVPAPAAVPGRAPPSGTSYDPYHERTLFAALAALYLPLTGAFGTARKALGLWSSIQQALVAGARAEAGVPSSGAGAPPQASNGRAPGTPTLAQAAESSGEAVRALQAVVRLASSAVLDVNEALVVSRWRSQTLPVRPVGSGATRGVASLSPPGRPGAATTVSVRTSLPALIADAMARASSSTSSSDMDMATGDPAATARTDTSTSSATALAPSVRVSLDTIDEAVPDDVRTDPRRWEHIVSAALCAACDVAGASSVRRVAGEAVPVKPVHVQVAWTHSTEGAVSSLSPSDPSNPGSLRLSLAFDCSGYSGGLDGLQAALGTDVLQSPGPFSPPGKPGQAMAADSQADAQAVSNALPVALTAEVLKAASSAAVQLPSLRHELACVGGNVTLASVTASGEVSQAGISAMAGLAQPVVLSITLPCPPVVRLPVVGPTLPEPAIAVQAAMSTPPGQVPAPGTAPGVPLSHGLAVMRPGSRLAVEATSMRPLPAMPEAGVAAAGAAAGVTPMPAPADADRPASPIKKREKPAEGKPAEAAAAPAPAPPASAAAGAAAPGPAAGVPPIQAPREAPGRKAAMSEAAGMRVLFVDDEEVNRRLGLRMLQRLGCEGQVAEDGDEVLDALTAAAAAGRPFDVILLDIIMARSDGVMVCQELRDTAWDLPVVAMTAATSQRDIQRYGQAGFDLVLPKPFDLKAMQKALVVARDRRARARGAKGGAAGAGTPQPGPVSTSTAMSRDTAATSQRDTRATEPADSARGIGSARQGGDGLAAAAAGPAPDSGGAVAGAQPPVTTVTDPDAAAASATGGERTTATSRAAVGSAAAARLPARSPVDSGSDGAQATATTSDQGRAVTVTSQQGTSTSARDGEVGAGGMDTGYRQEVTEGSTGRVSTI